MTTIPVALAALIANPFLALIFVVGVYGWWRLASRDSITESARRWFLLKWPHEGFSDQTERPKRGYSVYSGGVWYVQKGTFWGELLYCPYCLSWWIAIAQFGLYLVWPTAIIGLAFLHAARIGSGFLSKHA
jgi:hypothetical protein